MNPLVECWYPVQEEPDQSLPEGFESWRVDKLCRHDFCVEAHATYNEFRARQRETYSAELREAIEADRELMTDEFHGRDTAGSVPT